MRRVALLALLALALPMAAFANSLPVIPSFNLQIGPPLTVGDFTGGSTGCVTNANQAMISCSTGNYFNGVNINPPMPNPWVLNLVGPTGRILLDITSLRTTTGANCALNTGTNTTGSCNFMGTVEAFGTSVPGGTFEDSISGTLTRGPNGSPGNPRVLSTLTGELGNQSGVITDSSLFVEAVQFCQTVQAAQGCGQPGASGRIRAGFGSATLDVDTVVPEPGTLALLGTSVIGLAGMARRRFKLGK